MRKDEALQVETEAERLLVFAERTSLVGDELEDEDLLASDAGKDQQPQSTKEADVEAECPFLKLCRSGRRSREDTQTRKRSRKSRSLRMTQMKHR